MLPTEFLFPERKPGQGLEDYVHDLRKHVEDSWNEMRKRLNWLLERVHVTTETSGQLDRSGTRFMVVEFIPPGATKNDNGNFRLRIVENASPALTYDLQIEILVAGVWTDTKIFHG